MPAKHKQPLLISLAHFSNRIAHGLIINCGVEKNLQWLTALFAWQFLQRRFALQRVAGSLWYTSLMKRQE